MLTIRLTRKGKKNQPFFRIVVIDKRRSAKGGRAVEELGYLNPLTKKKSLNKERFLYWLKNGAQPTPRIHNLLVSEKIIEAKKINVFKLKKGKAGVAPSPIPAVPQGAPEAVSATKEPSLNETTLPENPPPASAQ